MNAQRFNDFMGNQLESRGSNLPRLNAKKLVLGAAIPAALLFGRDAVAAQTFRQAFSPDSGSALTSPEYQNLESNNCEIPTENTGFYWPSVSPDGDKVIFNGYDGQQQGFWILNRNDKSCNFFPQVADKPVWSNDGTRIFAYENGNIVTMLPDGTNVDVVFENAWYPIMIRTAADIRNPKEALEQSVENIGSLSFIKKGQNGQPDTIIRGTWIDYPNPIGGGGFFTTREIRVQGVNEIHTFTWNPDGTQLIVEGKEILYGPVTSDGERMLVDRKDGTNTKWRPEIPGITPAWHPIDNDTYAYTERDYTGAWAKTIIVSSGTIIEVNGQFREPSWFPDGQKLAMRGLNGDIYVVDFQMGSPNEGSINPVQLTQRKFDPAQQENPADLLG